MTPRVLNKYTASKADLATGVYIGRGSPWGNPFKIGHEYDRDAVCDKFECEILPSLDVSSLRGKNLICFCTPQRCHGESILKKANS